MEHCFILDKEYYYDKNYNPNDDWVDTYEYFIDDYNDYDDKYNLYYVCKKCGILGKKDLDNGEIIMYIENYSCEEYIIKNIIE